MERGGHESSESRAGTSLRQQAEARLRMTRTDVAEMDAEEVQRLIHELQVHQIELELQNEELRETQVALVDSRDKYSDLYDFAPVGYLTLNETGEILEANLKASDMLGVERAKLIGERISQFATRDSQDACYLHLREVFSSESTCTCEPGMKGRNGKLFQARLESIASRNGQGLPIRCRTALIDISAETEAREWAQQAERLKQMVDNLPAGAVFVEGNNLTLNRAAEEITGFSREEVSDLRDWYANLYPGQEREIRRLYGENRDAGFREPMISTIRCKKGRERVIEFAAHGFDGHEVWFLNDITERKRVEKALMESEERFRRIFENAPAGIAISGLDGRFDRCNPAYCALVQYSEKELRELDIASLVHPDDRDVNLADIRRLLDGEVSFFEIENRYVAGNGQPVWVHKFTLALPDGSGKPVQLVTLVTDLTARRRADMEIREREALLGAIFDSAVDAIITIDSHGIIVRNNPAAETIFGYTEKELVGSNVNILMPSPDRERHGDYINRYLETGEAKIIGIGREVVAKRKDGSTFPADLSVSQVGVLGMFTGVIRDISKRKQTEEALRHRQELSERLIDSAATLVLLIDCDGRIVRCNPTFRELTGYSPEEVDGLNFFEDFVSDGDRIWVRERFRCLEDGDFIQENVCTIMTKSGEGRTIECAIASLSDSDNAPVGLVITAVDITERLRLEREVVEASEEERARTARELHDGMGALLTGLKLHIEALRRSFESGKPVNAEDFDQIRSLAVEAITQSRSISKGLNPIGDGRGDLMDALKILAHRVDAHDHFHCRFRCPEWVAVESSVIANQIYRIAQEAVNNTVKHSQGSWITISLVRDGGRVVLKVLDNGRGFDSAMEEHDGLGLHTMRYRARMIGGSFTIEPRRKGGTRVVCSVPVE